MNATPRTKRRTFNTVKDELAYNFLMEFDEKVTDGQIASKTGGVKLIWNRQFLRTAGSAAEVISRTQSVTVRREAFIKLSEKLIDDEGMCNDYFPTAELTVVQIACLPCSPMNSVTLPATSSATWMTIMEKYFKSGKFYMKYHHQNTVLNLETFRGDKCTRIFQHRGVTVTTKHSFSINYYKYVWMCTGCGLEMKRHSKSIDPARHLCGSCESTLVQVQPPPRRLSRYHLFLKQHLKEVKEAHPKVPHKDIMAILGEAYRAGENKSVLGS
jgi:hypothetical protein